MLPVDRFVFRDERAEDYGVDGSLELLAQGRATNFRAQVQLKGTARAELNRDGSISLPVSASNLNYLLNGPSPLYILYSVPSDQLLFLWARDEQSRISEENPNWLQQDWVTLRFYQALTPEALGGIYLRIQTEGHLQRLEKDNAELQVRHLVCRCSDTLKDLFNGRLLGLPIPKAMLLDNEIFRAARMLLSEQAPEGGYYYAAFPDRARFLLAHPEAHEVSAGEKSRFPIFETRRTASVATLQRHAPHPIAACAGAGADPAELGVMVGYTQPGGECGPDESSFIELLRARPTYLAFLALTNVSDHPISLHALRAARAVPRDIGYRPFSAVAAEAHDHTVNLPRAGLGPGETVLIPECMLMAPLEYGGRHVLEVEQLSREGHVRTLNLEAWAGEASGTYHAIGPSLTPRSVVLAARGAQPREQSIHPLDLSCVYTLDSRWCVGSCPHVFWFDGNTRQWNYACEILVNSTPAAPSETILELPTQATHFRVVELEDEITYLDAVELAGPPGSVDCLASPVTLKRGEFLERELPRGRGIHRLRFVGRYVTDGAASGSKAKDVHVRCELVANYLCIVAAGLRYGWKVP